MSSKISGWSLKRSFRRLGPHSIVKVCVLILLAVSLCLTCCKKSDKESPPAPKEQPKDVNNKSDKTEDAKEEPNASASGRVPLDIKLPKPRFVGTPQNIQGVGNVEKPLGRPRPSFYAPDGTENVAFGKSVTSSDEAPIIGELEMLTDGDKEATDFSYVELGPLRQHVTIDLGGDYNIYAVLFWHYHKQARVYFDVVVQVADDPDFITNVQTIFNNDIDNSSGLGVGKDMHYVETHEGKLIGVDGAEGVRARYVRLYSNGSNADDLNHYIEVEVYGKPAK